MTLRWPLLAACCAVAVAAEPALAGSYSFTFAPFTDGASLTVDFSGTDGNADGLITGFVNDPSPSVDNEITALSVTFSGNSLIPAFTGSTTDFSSNGSQTLDFGGGAGVYALEYVSDAALADTTLSTTVLADGDAIILLSGDIIDFGNSTTASIELMGAACGQFAGEVQQTYFGGSACSGVSYEPVLPTAGNRISDFVPAPEPATLTLFGSGLFALAAARRRRAARG